MTTLMTDVRYAWRSLRQAPVFTTVAVLSIALGIGANAAIFTLVDQVLLRMLPVKDPARLVMLKGPTGNQHYGANYETNALSYPMYEDFRNHNEVFDGMFARFSFAVQLGTAGVTGGSAPGSASGASGASGGSGGAGGTERGNGEMVSGTYFPVLGVRPALGRLFGPDDDRTIGAAPYAVLTYAYWSNRFDRNPDILGKTLVVNNHPLTIVGVAEEGFAAVDVGQTIQLFVPIAMRSQMAPNYLIRNVDQRRARWVHVFGRLKPGITVEQADTSLQPFYRSVIAEEVKETAFARASEFTKSEFLRSRITVLSAAQGFSYLRGSLTRPLWVLMAMVGGVLLIACANVANLLVARGAGRQREIAIRLALGAGQWRVVQQLLVESLVIAFAGGVLGLLIATVSIGPLLSLLVPAERQVNVSTAIDLRMVGAAFAATVVTGLLFGLVPAWQAARPRLAPTLKDEAGSVTGSAGAVRLRKALVVVQVSLSLLLLIGAGLFVRSVNHLMKLDPGFRTSRLVSFALDPSLNGYDDARSRELMRSLKSRLQTIPGVERVAHAALPLLNNGGWDQWMTVEGYKTAENETIDPYCNAVSPGYFATLGIPIIAGRDFEERDVLPAGTRGDERVAIITESFAKRYFKDGRAIGMRIGMGKDPGTKLTTEIVGIVKDTLYHDVKDEVPYVVFFPSLNTSGSVLVETRLSAAEVFPAIRAAVRDLDPNLPVYKMQTIDMMLKQSTRNERLMASLSAVFGLLATLLAAIGLYGVLAYTVTRRTREIGIRMALGALRSHVSWLVLQEVLMLVTAGIAIALPAAWWLSTYIRTQLYGVAPMDPLALMLSLAGLSLVALLAGLIPTMRALRINPVRALRQG